MNRNNEFLLIVDGSSLLATSYYASLPKPVRKEKDEEKKEKLYPILLRQDAYGHYCNALDLFFHTLFTIMTFQHPTHLVICWDAGRNTFRKELWPAYKSNRQTTPTPLREQYETAYLLCERLGITQVRDTRYEADDFAGTIACEMAKYLPVRILTRDKDYFQLISDDIHIWYGMSDLTKVKQWRKEHSMPPCLPSRVVLVDEVVLKKEFGYSPQSVPMIKSLFGDASDNIPGVSGMGELRSIRLAEHYHTVDELYAPIETARTKAERKKLARLWKSWGISVSPYSVLTRKNVPNRMDAKDMASLCYTLGKIRTDLDLTDCFDEPFGPDLFRIQFQPSRIASVLRPYNIELKIGRSKFSLDSRPGRKKKASVKRPVQTHQKQAAKQAKTQAKKGAKPAASAKAKPAQQTAPAAKKPAVKTAVQNVSKKNSNKKQALKKTNAKVQAETKKPVAASTGNKKNTKPAQPAKKANKPPVKKVNKKNGGQKNAAPAPVKQNARPASRPRRKSGGKGQAYAAL